MRTAKLMIAILLIATSSVMAKKSVTSAKDNSYFVQVSHSTEQCKNALTEMKDKGDPYLSKFWFGCMSGDHTAYGILTGSSEDAVRKTLPKELQATAKIEKVDQFTSAQLNKMHQEKK